MKGLKTGGRQLGTPNRRTADIQRQLAELNCDPIAGMATIAMDATVPITIRASMFKELAQYVAPKRRSIEVADVDGGPVETQTPVTLDTARRIAFLLDKAVRAS